MPSLVVPKYASPPLSISQARRTWLERATDYFGMSNPAEFVAAATLFALLIALKLFNIAHRQFDSDEPQHMHVIWAWARGFLQYRDIFDNHMPLFQIMFAPIFGLIGDRPDILVWMRLILFPIYFVSAWCVYEIGALLFSRRVGVWAVILGGLFISSFCISFEFRTDNVWTAFWLLGLVVLLRGSFTVRRALAAGLLMGLCFAVSLKSTLLLMSILATAPIAWLLVRRKLPAPSGKQIVFRALAFFGTTLLIPGIIAGAFALNGLWSAFRYGVFDHNMFPMDGGHHASWQMAIFPLGFALAIGIARKIVRATHDAAIALRRGFIFLICGFYLPALYAFWRFITRQDFLPWSPLIAVFVSAALVDLSIRVTRFRKTTGIVGRFSLPACVALLEFAVVFVLRPPWRDAAREEIKMLRDILTLTDPGDYVVDAKGEAIFRQRAFWPVMESITLTRFERGLMIDDTVQRCIERQACVAIGGRMSDEMMKFLHENYVPVANNIRVAGVRLPGQNSPTDAHEFTVAIPASYKIISPNVAVVTGLLDGKPYQGETFFLTQGKHTFLESSSAHDCALIWAKAADRHFTPFAYRDAPNG